MLVLVLGFLLQALRLQRGDFVQRGGRGGAGAAAHWRKGSEGEPSAVACIRHASFLPVKRPGDWLVVDCTAAFTACVSRH